MNTLASPPVAANPGTRRWIQAAGQAPSPDNNQPWAFRAVGDVIEVYHRRERALPSDVRDLFSWISLGAAIENMVLATSRDGCLAQVEYHERPFVVDCAGEHIATIHVSGGAEADPLHAFIEQRETNRRLYDRDPLSVEETDKLSQAVLQPSHRVGWLRERGDRRRLAKLVAAADRIRFEDRESHEEFHRVLRFTDEEARRTADGLDLRTLEIPRPLWPVLRWLRPWSRMRFANRVGLSHVFADYSVKQVRGCGAVGMLTTEHPGDAGYLEAGRSLQRIWLRATQMGLAFQPMGSVPLFLTLLAKSGGESLRPVDRVRLQTVRAGIAALYPQISSAAPVMLFRVGRAAKPSVRSYRYPLTRILLTADAPSMRADR